MKAVGIDVSRGKSKVGGFCLLLLAHGLRAGHDLGRIHREIPQVVQGALLQFQQRQGRRGLREGCGSDRHAAPKLLVKQVIDALNAVSATLERLKTEMLELAPYVGVDPGAD